MKVFTADFETTTDINNCRVWAFALCEVGNTDNFIYGNNIASFIDFCKNKKENYKIWFHNLKFDGEYIFSYLLKNGYELIEDKKERRDNTFTCIIADTGQFYSIEIYFHVTKSTVNKVTIYDSMKVLNFSVKKIAKAFGLPISKLKLDYDTYREVGHILTEHEVEYIRNDVTIVAMALKHLFDLGLNKMTIGSDALSWYKKDSKYFNKYFPVLPTEIDLDIRKSYKGGFTYLNDIYKNVEVGKGVVLDVNSLYPSVMVNEKLPFGEPLFFEGQYKYDPLYPLYIQTLTCSFKIKPNKIPSIQLKNNFMFAPNEYILSSDDEPVTLTLTNIDLELFFEQYDVKIFKYHNGWQFKEVKGLFTEYVNYWTEKKIESKKNKNKPMYMISKLLLNSLYGKFGLSPYVRSKFPYLDENGIVNYQITPLSIRKGIYIPIATFVTSYARRKTILTSQAIRDYTLEKYGEDYYYYSDTDSIHAKYLPEEELKQFVDIDDYRLGAWKLESEFTKAKFIRQKCYIEENELTKEDYLKKKNDEDFDGNIYEHEGHYFELNTTIAGMPKFQGKYINFENFNVGLSLEESDPTIEHKKMFKHVKGGVLLVDTDFTIK